jgi:aminomethyltransferase
MNAVALNNYYAIVDGCGLIELPDHALIWGTGRDRLDLLHRMSTNDLTGMRPNEGRATVLTTALARIVDRLIVVNLEETSEISKISGVLEAPRVLMLGSARMGQKIRRWLAGYIFFQDEVMFTDASTEMTQLRLFGPRAGAVAEALAPGASALKPYHVLRQDGAIIGRGDPLGGDSFFIVVEKGQAPMWGERALAAGAVTATPEVYDVIRIESGLPEIDREISEDYIPLEANLWNDVSFSKGCYIGQEIIARMESRGKLAKRLTGWRSEGPLALTEFSGGAITSVTESPRFGWIALGYVKPAQVEVGTEFELNGTRATIAALPFTG